MSENSEAPSWKINAPEPVVHFFDAVREAQRNRNDDLWEKYSHRAANLAGQLLLPAIENKSKKNQMKNLKNILRKKREEDPKFAPLLRQLLPKDFSWEEKKQRV